MPDSAFTERAIREVGAFKELRVDAAYATDRDNQ
jgi:hypothetical protein